MNILSLVKNGGIKLQKICSLGVNPASINSVNNWSFEILCLCNYFKAEKIVFGKMLK